MNTIRKKWAVFPEKIPPEHVYCFFIYASNTKKNQEKLSFKTTDWHFPWRPQPLTFHLLKILVFRNTSFQKAGIWNKDQFC